MAAVLSLVMETSTPRASMVLVRGDEMVGARGFSSDRSHNSLLFAPLEELLALRDGEPLGQVLVGSGPGSYSGTRVGIAAAQGVAMAMGCPAIAVPSITAVPAAGNGARCLAIGDARRGSYWTAGVQGLQVTHGPVLGDAAELLEKTTSAIAVGAAVFCFEDPRRLPLPEDVRAQVSWQFPEAGLLWRAWQATDDATKLRWTAEIPQPLYLKPPHVTPAKPAPWRAV